METIPLVATLVASAIFAVLVEYLSRSVLPEKPTGLVFAITITACVILIIIVVRNTPGGPPEVAIDVPVVSPAPEAAATSLVTPPVPTASPEPTLTASPTMSPSLSATAASGRLQVNRNDDHYEAETLDEYVPANHILCIITGPIVVDLAEDIVFHGGTRDELRGTVVCWIGEQRAYAYALEGGHLGLWIVSNGTMEQHALELVREGEQELRLAGCGDRGPCTIVDHVIVRPDGSTMYLPTDQQ